MRARGVKKAQGSQADHTPHGLCCFQLRPLLGPLVCPRMRICTREFKETQHKPHPPCPCHMPLAQRPT
eukprot:1136878-Pelagomonas_calceolata.AAC.1